MEIVINTKNAGEEVLTFDCSKIAAAIVKAFESIQPVMEEAVQNISSALTAFAETMEEHTRPLMESIERASYRFIRHFLRMLMLMRSRKIMLRSFCESLLLQCSQQKSLSIKVYSPLRNAFRSGSSFQSGMLGVFIFLSIVSNALRRASGFAFAYTCVVSMDSCPRKSRM